VLTRAVTRDGLVRWEVIRNNEHGTRDALLRYAGLIAAVSPHNRSDLFKTDDDRLAYYVNAYNALCMYAIVQHNYPENLQHAGPAAGAAVESSLFTGDKFMVGGQPMTLDELLSKKLRSSGDPRVHFALNCGTRSSPPLRGDPYEGYKLEEQFREQGRRFLSDPRGAVRDGADVKISEIFERYGDDFLAGYEKKTGHHATGLLQALQLYAAPDSPVAGAGGCTFMSYDWSLNTAR
jgi:hypothetical protein